MCPPRDERRGKENLESPHVEVPETAVDRRDVAAGDVAARDAVPPSSASAPFDTLENGTMPDPVPDLRRDALEEAAETSPEARERVQELDRRDAAANPAFGKPRRTS
jgi:hypothetical protein